MSNFLFRFQLFVCFCMFLACKSTNKPNVSTLVISPMIRPIVALVQKQVDSIIAAKSHLSGKRDSLIARYCHQKGNEFIEKNDSIAYHLFDYALQLRQLNKDTTLEWSNSYYRLSSAAKNLNNYIKAIEYIQISLKIAQQLSEKPEIIARRHKLLGSHYDDIGDYYRAIQNYQIGLSLVPDSLKSSYYQNLTVTYNHLFDNKNALEYAPKALFTKDKENLAGAYVNLGIAFRLNQDYKESINAFKQAEKLYLWQKNIDTLHLANTYNELA